MNASFRREANKPFWQQQYRRRRRPEETVELLGARMDLVKPQEVFHFVSTKIAANEQAVIANHNIHSLALYKSDAELRAFYARADLTQVDCMPLVVWAKLIGHPARAFHRSTYLDWRDEFWAMAEMSGWRVFMLGGTEEVSAEAIARIKAEFPRVRLAGRSGHFDGWQEASENRAVLAEIEQFGPEVLLVGMGMPRQELWVMQNLDKLPACSIFTLGGVFDNEAGVELVCPPWVEKLGLEWAWRLAADPERTFQRYCVEPWNLLPEAYRDLSDFAARKRRLAETAARIERAGGLL